MYYLLFFLETGSQDCLVSGNYDDNPRAPPRRQNPFDKPEVFYSFTDLWVCIYCALLQCWFWHFMRMNIFWIFSPTRSEGLLSLPCRVRAPCAVHYASFPGRPPWTLRLETCVFFLLLKIEHRYLQQCFRY